MEQLEVSVTVLMPAVHTFISSNSDDVTSYVTNHRFQESGASALGAAALVSIMMASKHPGSKVSTLLSLSLFPVLMTLILL